MRKKLPIMLPKLSRLRGWRHLQTRILMIWTLVAVLFFGVAGAVDPLEDLSRTIRNKIRDHEASGQVVVVGIDTLAMQDRGNWPWTYGDYAELVRKLDKAGARRIVFDIKTSNNATAEDRQLLADALKQADDKVYLTANFVADSSTGRTVTQIPPAEFRQHARLVNSNFWINGYNAVQTTPYALKVGDLALPSIAAELSGETGKVGEDFPIDYSVNLYSIPYISAADVLRQSRELDRVKGKDVIIGLNEPSIGQRHSILGHGLAASTFIVAVGTETLIEGRPIQLGWLPPLLFAFLLCAIIVYAPRRAYRVAAFALGMLLLLAGPIALETMRIFMNYMPAIFMLGCLACHYAWSRHRQSFQDKGMFNEISGLPNLNALRQEAQDCREGLIAARIHNYAEVATALPAAREKDLADQISMRLSLGNGARKIYHGDEGIFMWLVPEETIATVGDQLSALHAIFRSPANIDGRNIDLSITFGVDADPGRSMQSRMSSALLAMHEAANAGEKWRVYDPSRLEATEWKVSLLGELDAAIDSGEVWVAFQPKLDLIKDEVCGAEALVRWTHPEKGAINPEEFILAAEKHDRIEKLTEHVLNTAVEAAARINRESGPFDIAVNLSPRLVGTDGLRPMVASALKRFGLPPERLILEITETAAMSSATEAMDELHALRAMGLQLSIDDYGTGFSTLDYLKRCPSSEIKIDRSFIRVLGTSRSDRIMVNSTIELAHSLGEVVVAEGIEDSETLQLLKQMGCDKAQGFLIGRPMPIEALHDFLARFESSSAAA
ncbi:MAG: EAL domain-containing protein [Blastomonas sp.]